MLSTLVVRDAGFFHGMRTVIFFVALAAVFFGQPHAAHAQTDGQAAEKPVEGSVQTDAEGRIVNRVAEFYGIDKITGRIISFDVYVNETVQFGQLQVTPRVCYSRPITETPKTTVFVEVDEQTLDRQLRRIFTGWMFADSPGLNAIEHPIFDIWLKDCKMESQEVPPPSN